MAANIVKVSKSYGNSYVTVFANTEPSAQLQVQASEAFGRACFAAHAEC